VNSARQIQLVDGDDGVAEVSIALGVYNFFESKSQVAGGRLRPRAPRGWPISGFLTERAELAKVSWLRNHLPDDPG
jgi:hypothetical protein